MRNSIFRQYARLKGVRLWELAESMNVSEAYITRALHKELDQKELAEWKAIVDQIAKTH